MEGPPKWWWTPAMRRRWHDGRSAEQGRGDGSFGGGVAPDEQADADSADAGGGAPGGPGDGGGGGDGGGE